MKDFTTIKWEPWFDIYVWSRFGLSDINYDPSKLTDPELNRWKVNWYRPFLKFKETTIGLN